MKVKRLGNWPLYADPAYIPRGQIYLNSLGQLHVGHWPNFWMISEAVDVIVLHFDTPDYMVLQAGHRIWPSHEEAQFGYNERPMYKAEFRFWGNEDDDEWMIFPSPVYVERLEGSPRYRYHS